MSKSKLTALSSDKMENVFLTVGIDLDENLAALVKLGPRTGYEISRLAYELQHERTRELTCYQMLNHIDSEGVIIGVIDLLSGNNDAWISGNAAYVLSNLCDVEEGKLRILEMMFLKSSENGDERILNGLNSMLASEDKGVATNASGFLACVADCIEGLTWLLRKFDLDATLSLCFDLVTQHVACGDAASNCAMFLSRLTTIEEGCARILNQRPAKANFVKLIQSLDSGIECSTHVALCVASLLESHAGSLNLLRLRESSQMIRQLIGLFCCDDSSRCVRNACFAINHLCSREVGLSRVLEHPSCEQMTQQMIKLISSADLDVNEATGDIEEFDEDQLALFAVMTFRTLVKRDTGCIYLRDHPLLRSSLLGISERSIREDLREEIRLLTSMIAPLPRPSPPTVIVESAHSATIKWDLHLQKNNLETIYHVYQNKVEIYSGTDTMLAIKTLKPVTEYSFHLGMSSEGHWSEASAEVVVATPESIPSAPTRFVVSNRTTSQLKVSWHPPLEPNGKLIGYSLTLVNRRQSLDLRDFETYYIYNNLQPGFEYHFEVCAITKEGKGDPAQLVCNTDGLGKHAPHTPLLKAVGTTSITVNWSPPERPLGRLNFYELKMNGKVIYSGLDRNYTATRLRDNTEYDFVVAAWTSEGRCESLPGKMRTKKAEKVHRKPLYKVTKESKESKRRQSRFDTPYSIKASRARKQANTNFKEEQQRLMSAVAMMQDQMQAAAGGDQYEPAARLVESKILDQGKELSVPATPRAVSNMETSSSSKAASAKSSIDGWQGSPSRNLLKKRSPRSLKSRSSSLKSSPASRAEQAASDEQGDELRTALEKFKDLHLSQVAIHMDRSTPTLLQTAVLKEKRWDDYHTTTKAVLSEAEIQSLATT